MNLKIMEILPKAIEAGLAVQFNTCHGEEAFPFVQVCLHDFNHGGGDVFTESRPMVVLELQENYHRADGAFRITVTCKNVDGYDLANFFEDCFFCNPIEVDWSGCANRSAVVALLETDLMPAFEWVLKRKSHIRYGHNHRGGIENVRLLNHWAID